ncbi:MAG: hypothetical protein LKF31_02815 [Muribaculaceae bacterium]|jgi:hypothetical protein|nr:hypothetical protein [Muribaculaceae bacterium]
MKSFGKFLMAIVWVIVILLIFAVVGGILAGILCKVGTGPYPWYMAIWHGLFFIPNFVRHLIWTDVAFIASVTTTVYTVLYWIVAAITVLIVIGSVFGGKSHKTEY